MLGYLDPGTGSIIIQAVIGGVAGFFVMLKMFGRRMFSFLPWVKSDKTAEDAIDAAIADDTDSVGDNTDVGDTDALADADDQVLSASSDGD